MMVREEGRSCGYVKPLQSVWLIDRYMCRLVSYGPFLVSLKLDGEMSPSLLPPWESVDHSQGLRALRQCREGVGLSTERWYGDGVEMVVYQS